MVVIFPLTMPSPAWSNRRMKIYIECDALSARITTDQCNRNRSRKSVKDLIVGETDNGVPARPIACETCAGWGSKPTIAIDTTGGGRRMGEAEKNESSYAAAIRRTEYYHKLWVAGKGRLEAALSAHTDDVEALTGVIDELRAAQHRAELAEDERVMTAAQDDIAQCRRNIGRLRAELAELKRHLKGNVGEKSYALGIEQFPPVEGGMLKPKAVAAHLGVSTSTLKGWRATGRGPVWYKLEGVVRYSPIALGEWVDARRRSGSRAKGGE